MHKVKLLQGLQCTKGVGARVTTHCCMVELLVVRVRSHCSMVKKVLVQGLEYIAAWCKVLLQGLQFITALPHAKYNTSNLLSPRCLSQSVRTPRESVQVCAESKQV